MMRKETFSPPNRWTIKSEGKLSKHVDGTFMNETTRTPRRSIRSGQQAPGNESSAAAGRHSKV